MNKHPEFPFYEYQFFSDAKKMCDWLNKQPNTMRIINCFTTGGGAYHIVTVRERQAGE
jgi:hypothetical protein